MIDVILLKDSSISWLFEDRKKYYIIEIKKKKDFIDKLLISKNEHVLVVLDNLSLNINLEKKTKLLDPILWFENKLEELIKADKDIIFLHSELNKCDWKLMIQKEELKKVDYIPKSKCFLFSNRIKKELVEKKIRKLNNIPKGEYYILVNNIFSLNLNQVKDGKELNICKTTIQEESYLFYIFIAMIFFVIFILWLIISVKNNLEKK